MATKLIIRLRKVKSTLARTNITNHYPRCINQSFHQHQLELQHRSEPRLVQIGLTSPNERLRHPQPPYPKHLNNPEKPAFGLILSKCTLTPECLIEHIYSAFHSDTEEEVSYGVERCTSASIPSSRRVFALAFSTPSLLINHAAIVTSKSGRVGKFTTANAGTSFPE